MIVEESLVCLNEDVTLEAKGMDSEFRHARVGIPGLLLNSCVTLDNILCFSELQFPSIKQVNNPCPSGWM